MPSHSLYLTPASSYRCLALVSSLLILHGMHLHLHSKEAIVRLALNQKLKYFDIECILLV